MSLSRQWKTIQVAKQLKSIVVEDTPLVHCPWRLYNDETLAECEYPYSSWRALANYNECGTVEGVTKTVRETAEPEGHPWFNPVVEMGNYPNTISPWATGNQQHLSC
ncbi:hypothetical protein GEMRC1_004890 [Eukaryota sp. GEM-RC1]